MESRDPRLNFALRVPLQGAGPDSTEWHGTIRLIPAACSSAGARAQRRCATAGSRRPRDRERRRFDAVLAAGILVRRDAAVRDPLGTAARRVAVARLAALPRDRLDRAGDPAWRSSGCSPRSWARSRSRCGSTASWKIVRRASGHEQEKGALETHLRDQHGGRRHRVPDLVPRDPGARLRHRSALMGLLDYYKQFDDIGESEFNAGAARAPRGGEGAGARARADARPVAARNGRSFRTPRSSAPPCTRRVGASTATPIPKRRRCAARSPSATTSGPARSCSATAPPS